MNNQTFIKISKDEYDALLGDYVEFETRRKILRAELNSIHQKNGEYTYADVIPVLRVAELLNIVLDKFVPTKDKGEQE